MRGYWVQGRNMKTLSFLKKKKKEDKSKKLLVVAVLNKSESFDFTKLYYVM